MPEFFVIVIGEILAELIHLFYAFARRNEEICDVFSVVELFEKLAFFKNINLFLHIRRGNTELYCQLLDR